MLPTTPRSPSQPGRYQHLLLVLIVCAAVLGLVPGYFAPSFSISYLKIFGEMFLAALRGIIVPLVMTSMICGVASLGDVRRLGRMGGTTVAYYMTTTFMAVLLGLILVNIIRPGDTYQVDREAAQVAAAEKLEQRGDYELSQAFHDIIMSFFSTNIIKSMAEMDILPLIMFSLILGAILTTTPRGRLVLDVVEGLNEAFLKFVKLIILFTPLGVLGLVSAKLGEATLKDDGAFFLQLAALGQYAFTVVLGLLVHGLVVLPIILRWFTRRSPLLFITAMGKALMTAFATASSSATLPVTIDSLERQAEVSARSAGFVAPLGATINMDGTALYEAVAAMFIAQSFGIELTITQQVIVFFTATLAAIGAAGIPEAGLVTLILVLKAVELPLEGIGLILAIDWLLDRCRTTVNVWGDAVGAAVMDKLVPEDR